VRLLLDTHILLWSTESPERLSPEIRQILDHSGTELYFSVVSLWEIGVKKALNRPDFLFDPHALRTGLLAHSYRELPLIAEHALAVDRLPTLHKDPFDRLLLCQALVEDLIFVTNDRVLSRYPATVRQV